MPRLRGLILVGPHLLIKLTALLLTLSAFVGASLAQTSNRADVPAGHIKSLKGDSFRLTDGSSKATLLFICASWARLCDFAAKDMNKLQRVYSTRGVDIIGLTNENPDKDRLNVEKFVRRNKIKFKFGWMNDEMENALTDPKHPGLVPIVIVLDQQHRIDRKFVGYSMKETPDRIIAVINRLIADE